LGQAPNVAETGRRDWADRVHPDVQVAFEHRRAIAT